jgi:hypothetical protein
MPARGHILIAHSQNYGFRKHRSHLLIKRSLKFPLLCVACLFVFNMTIFLAHRPDSIAQRGDSSRDILKEDRKFLDDLFQKMNPDDSPGWESSLLPIQKIGNPDRLESSAKSVPRAVMVVNDEIVRRGELIVPSGAVKRKRQSVTAWRRHTEAL